MRERQNWRACTGFQTAARSGERWVCCEEQRQAEVSGAGTVRVSLQFAPQFLFLEEGPPEGFISEECLGWNPDTEAHCDSSSPQ